MNIKAIADKISILGIATKTNAEIVSDLKAIKGVIGRLPRNKVVNYDAQYKCGLAIDEIINHPEATSALKYEAEIFREIVKGRSLDDPNIGDATTQYALNEFVKFKGGDQNFTQLMKDKLEDAARTQTGFETIDETTIAKARLLINPVTIETSYEKNNYVTRSNGVSVYVDIDLAIDEDDKLTVFASSKKGQDSDFAYDNRPRGHIYIKAGEIGRFNVYGGEINTSGLNEEIKLFVTSQFNRAFTAQTRVND